RGAVGDAAYGDGGRARFVEGHGQAAVSQQVDAVEARVASELVDLGEDGVELRSQACADCRIRCLLRLADERLSGLNQLRDRRNAVVRSLNGLERVRHRVEQGAE